MASSKKLASWDIKQYKQIKRHKNNYDSRYVFGYLDLENSYQNQIITTNKNMNKLHNDWSGYCDELDPY